MDDFVLPSKLLKDLSHAAETIRGHEFIQVFSHYDADGVSAAAIVAKDKKRGVWVIQDGRLTFKEVTIGIEDRSNLSEIVAGLDAGDRVAVAPPANMAKFKEGMRVRGAK